MALNNFPHDRLKFTLAAHQKMSNGQPFTCADCHGDNVAEFDRAKCETCHREYQADFVTKHVADFGNDCLACHDGADRFSRFDHNRLPFALSGEHSQIACGQCHTQARAVADFKSASAQLRRLPPERRRPQRRVRDGLRASATTRTDWKDAKFDHNLAAFKLVGKHQTVECAQCHVNNVFKGTPQNCAACHQKDDPHKARSGRTARSATIRRIGRTRSSITIWRRSNWWASTRRSSARSATSTTCSKARRRLARPAIRRTIRIKGAFGTDCAQCHNPSDWKDAKFDHNLAAFKLTGAHVNVPCAKCHINGVFKGTPQTCVSCHAEPQQHLGAFGTDCAQCHTTQTWQGATFDHVFPLNHGGGGNIACQTCHTTTNFKEYTCYGCHDHDPARIQARHLDEGISDFQDCVRCHARGQREGGD